MKRPLGHATRATLAVKEDEIGVSALDRKIEAFLADLRDARDRT